MRFIGRSDEPHEIVFIIFYLLDKYISASITVVHCTPVQLCYSIPSLWAQTIFGIDLCSGLMQSFIKCNTELFLYFPEIEMISRARCSEAIEDLHSCQINHIAYILCVTCQAERMLFAGTVLTRNPYDASV